MEIKGRVIIVTGGVGNLGGAIVKTLEAEGAIVIVLDLQKVNKLNYYAVDLCNERKVVEIIEIIIEKYKKIDVLINNAGVIYSEPLVNILNPLQRRHSYESFSKYVTLNLDTTFITGSIVAEQMVLKRTKGLIINMSSISAVGNAGQSAYSAAKAGVEALTRTWSKELGVFGIRSIAISPGFINTNSTSLALNESMIKYIKKNTPLRSLGEVENISDTILFAIKNDYLNGEVVNVNGGLTI